MIVLCHGFAQSGNCWLKLAQEVVQRHPTAVVILPDLVGFGKSSGAAKDVGLSQPLFVEHIEYCIRVEQCRHLPVILVRIVCVLERKLSYMPVSQRLILIVSYT